MPTYTIETNQGSFEVDANREPTDAEVMTLIKAGHAAPPPQDTSKRQAWEGGDWLDRLNMLERNFLPQAAKTDAEVGKQLGYGALQAVPTAVGAYTGGPPGAVVGAGVGNSMAQFLKMRNGEQQSFQPGPLAGSMIAAAIPGGSLTKAGAGQVMREGAKYAAGNLAATAAQTGIDEGRLPTLREAAQSAGAGFAAGPIAKFADTGALAAQAAIRQSQQSIKQATLNAAREAGYVVTPAYVNPSGLNKTLESFAGKAATAQEAQLRNAEITTALARKDMGLPVDAPMSKQAIQNVRAQAGKPYAEVAGLSAQAAADLDALKQARFNASAAWSRRDDPASLTAARAYDDEAEILENSLEKTATAQGRPGLVDQLRDSRKLIAKTYAYENALNLGDGSISAKQLGRALDNGAKFSDELETIAKFEQAFSRNIADQAKIPPPGVSQLGNVLAVGAAGAGGAAGYAASGVPGALGGTAAGMMLSPVINAARGRAADAARNVLLSKFYQQKQANLQYPGLNQPDFRSSLARFSTQNAGR